MEKITIEFTQLISHLLEIAAAATIAIALLRWLYIFLRNIPSSRNSLKAQLSRGGFGHSVALSLELLLGADVLATAVNPEWDAIGKLAAIAAIRTALNYFLAKELQEENLNQSSESRQA